MVGIKRSMAVLGFVTAMITGGVVGVSAFGELAPEPVFDPFNGGFSEFQVVGADEVTTFMVATVEPHLGGQMLTITFGPAIGEGGVVAMIPLVPGPNLFPVPRSMVVGVYTGEVCGRLKAIGAGEAGVE